MCVYVKTSPYKNSRTSSEIQSKELNYLMTSRLTFEQHYQTKKANNPGPNMSKENKKSIYNCKFFLDLVF